MYTLPEDDIKMGENVSIEQYNKEIDEAIAGAEAGDFVTQTEMENKFQSGKGNKMATVEKNLKKFYEYILQTTIQNAEKVKSALIFSTKKIADHPEIYPPHKYKKTQR
jgi:hypothetical protein